MNVTIAELDRMHINDLHDDDLIMIWDTSDHNRRSELEDKYGATKNLPSSIKSFRVGDLRDRLLDSVRVELKKNGWGLL